jgi:hypothetical protein
MHRSSVIEWTQQATLFGRSCDRADYARFVGQMVLPGKVQNARDTIVFFKKKDLLSWRP